MNDNTAALQREIRCTAWYLASSSSTIAIIDQMALDSRLFFAQTESLLRQLLLKRTIVNETLATRHIVRKES